MNLTQEAEPLLMPETAWGILSAAVVVTLVGGLLFARSPADDAGGTPPIPARATVAQTGR